jgi:hypothetical protein
MTIRENIALHGLLTIRGSVDPSPPLCYPHRGTALTDIRQHDPPGDAFRPFPTRDRGRPGNGPFQHTHCGNTVKGETVMVTLCPPSI